MNLMSILWNIPARLFSLLRRRRDMICEEDEGIESPSIARLRITRISWVQIVVLLLVMFVIFWRRQHSIDSYKLTMGQEGAVFKNIIDDVTWDVNEDGRFEIRNHGDVVLATNLGYGFRSTFGIVTNCKSSSNNDKCLQWEKAGKTTVHAYSDKNANCFDVRSASLDNTHHPMDCFDLENGDTARTFWYGGAETYHDRWPIDLRIKERAHVSDTGGYGSVLDRYWFSSRGVGVFVDDPVPLHVKADGKSLCLIGKFDGDTYMNYNNEMPYLKYTICVKGNVLDIHKYMSERYIRKPKGIPDEKMIKYPVWSTWAKFKSAITQELTIQYTDEIVNHGFPACQIEVDDRYTVNYGDYIFDAEKFPNPKEMISYIHSKSFRVTVWTHPFSNSETKSYTEGKERGFWVKDESGSSTGLAQWWRGRGGVLDVTNPEAVTWFFERMAHIRNLGVDGHKYDAGEIGFLPKRFHTKKQLQNPCQYSRIYAEAMHNNTNRFMQVRVGYKTQHLPIFVSMMDRNSDWGYNMGLRSLITTSLVFSSMGYFFIMPDMIGGNAYCQGNMDCNLVLPERELFIRWIQLNAFLPMMQFSITPWQYDDEVVAIARKYVDLHADYVAPKIITLGKQAISTGDAIIRPMWWVAPDDPVTYDMDSQFMVGNELLVAPILDKGISSRRVYLPKGVWKDMNSGTEYHVEVFEYFIESYSVSIDQIPYFERVLIP